MNKTKPAIVGDGRLATHLAHYFGLLNQPVVQWSRKEAEKGPIETLEGCSPIILALSDRAIEPFLEQYPQIKEMSPIHCSGSLTVPGVPGYHPLMAFGQSLYDEETYRSIPFITEKGQPTLSEILSFLPNREFSIDPQQKSLYHALCVSAGNFPALILQQVSCTLDQLPGIEWEAFGPYLKQNLANSLSDPDGALTGPIVRNDSETIERNLNSLEGNPLEPIYRAVQEMYAAQK